jgi:hypothetical protein
MVAMSDWLGLRRIDQEEPNNCAEDDLVFDDNYLAWGNVDIALGVEEERFNMGSRARSLGRATGSGSGSICNIFLMRERLLI